MFVNLHTREIRGRAGENVKALCELSGLHPAEKQVSAHPDICVGNILVLRFI